MHQEIVNKSKALVEAAKEVERAARDTESEKKKEIQAVQLKIGNLIGDLKNANLIDGIDDQVKVLVQPDTKLFVFFSFNCLTWWLAALWLQIASLERTLQHETMTLKQEKQLVEEIKKLKERREKLSSGMDPEMQIKEALDLKNQISASLKV